MPMQYSNSHKLYHHHPPSSLLLHSPLTIMHLRLSPACFSAANHISPFPVADNFSELDRIIARGTSSDNLPFDDRCAWKLTAVITASPLSSTAFPLSFARRFGRTRSMYTALKCLLLLHRLLRLLPSNHPFHGHLIASRDKSLLSLRPPRHFHNNLFIHSYAILLDELLTWQADMEGDAADVAHVLEKIPHLQRQLDRSMSCRLAAPARQCDVIQSVMKQVVRESFVCYSAIQKGLEAVLDGLLQLPYPSCIAGIKLYGHAGRQAGQLAEFYDWSRSAGICCAYEYPMVERIPEIQVQALRSFVERMWQLTGDFSSASTSPKTTSSSSSSSMSSLILTESWEKFEEEELEEQKEEKPLIKINLDESGNSWEVLLEASVDRRPLLSTLRSFTHDKTDSELLHYCKRDGRMVQTYKRNPFNPFFDHIEERSNLPSQQFIGSN